MSTFFAKKFEEWLKHVLTVYCFYRKFCGTFPKTYLDAKRGMLSIKSRLLALKIKSAFGGQDSDPTCFKMKQVGICDESL